MGFLGTLSKMVMEADRNCRHVEKAYPCTGSETWNVGLGTAGMEEIGRGSPLGDHTGLSIDQVVF